MYTREEFIVSSQSQLSVVNVLCLPSMAYCTVLFSSFPLLQGGFDRDADSSRDYRPQLIKMNPMFFSTVH